VGGESVLIIVKWSLKGWKFVSSTAVPSFSVLCDGCHYPIFRETRVCAKRGLVLGSRRKVGLERRGIAD